MKSRKKITLQNKLVTKRSDTTLDKTTEKLPRKRIHSSTSLQHNLDFLQQHSKLFSKSLYNCAGDADSYFKQSLRNYEYFDFRVFQPSLKNLTSARSVRSTETKSTKKAVDQQKKKSKGTSTKKKEKKSEPLPQSKEKDHPEERKDSEEVDFDIFYSPSSRTYQSSTGTIKNNGSQTTIRSQTDLEVAPKDFKMAEDEEEFPGELGEEFEGENETDAQFVEAVPGVAEEEEIGVREEEAEERGAVSPEEDEVYMLEGGEDEDEMKDVARMVEEASTAFEQVGEEIPHPISDIDEAEEDGEERAGGDGSTFKFDPAIDAAVLRELEAAEKQAKETAKIIFELKTRVTELLKKDQTTEQEARELEQKNKELKTQMMLFEEKTKRIQCLIAQTNLFENLVPPQPPLQVKHKEDVLPKVIVCGLTENNMPKLIVCDDKKRKEKFCCNKFKPKEVKEVNVPMSVVPQFAKRLSDSYCMQERLAAENADLEGMRYKLQSDLLGKDQTIEYLQQKLCSIQYEMRMLCKENNVLNERMQVMCSSKQDSSKCKKLPCGKGKGSCPAEVENRLNDYSETTKVLEKQLAEMECEVKNMQTELCAVQAERDHLEQHRKILICPTPICVQTPCPPPPCSPPCSVCPPPPCPMPCPMSMPPCGPSAEQQLRELREQYCRLQDDFKGKVTEVATIRADNERQKAIVKEAEELKKLMDDKIKEYERTFRMMKLEKNQFAGSKEQLIEQESQLAVAKQRFREAQDELEELRAFVQDQKGQIDDYRNKYLEAQQTVEEQRRQIDLLEMDSNRVNEQVNLEIQRVKNQFQEKLQELLPLPDMLKTTQLKLSEAQQMHLLAERNNEALTKELQVYKDKVAAIANQMQQVRSDQQLGEDGRVSMSNRIQELEVKLNELVAENDQLRVDLIGMEELANDNETKAQEKLHEIAQLNGQLESVREESARQVARNKERCETVRRSMQNQITDLERQLAQSRAQARTAQKDRDEIRQKMQAQISNLHENFEDAQMRIRNLQGHVNFLKDSYNTTTVPGLGGMEPAPADNQDQCLCGAEY